MKQSGKKMPDIKTKSKLEDILSIKNFSNATQNEKRTGSSKPHDRKASKDKGLQTDLICNEMISIKNLWEQLGVVDNYKQVFESVICDLDMNIRKDFLDFEISSLIKFHEQLVVL
jgi:hypothetical protein